MGKPLRALIRALGGGAGDSARKRAEKYPDIEPEFFEIHDRCAPYTMTHTERMYSLYKAVQYIVHHDIPGDMVECGVWKGGSAMVLALALMKFGDTSRSIYLYDTYEGMPQPTGKDISTRGADANEIYKQKKTAGHTDWCYCPVEQVREHLHSTGYPREKLIFVKGKVEQTIPAQTPQTVSILRLDTDWYESTYHELTHLYPRLSMHGVLLIDDYGYWKGSKEATDQYFTENGVRMLLNRIDSSSRIGVRVN